MPLQPFGQPRQDDPGGGDDDDAEEHGVGLERLAAIVDHVADAFAAAEHLADDNADEAERYGLAHAGQDERDGTGHDDSGENLPVRRAERAGGAQQVAVDGAHASYRVD